MTIKLMDGNEANGWKLSLSSHRIARTIPLADVRAVFAKLVVEGPYAQLCLTTLLKENIRLSND
jgi:hypothetical protein